MLPERTPDLIALDLLVSVAELGSLGQTGLRHHLSQPAVSMRMNGLERRLGLELLKRDPSGTRLTPAGQQIVVGARRVLAETEALMVAVDRLKDEGGARLRVAASLTVADHLLPSWIDIVHREVPGVSLALEVTNSARVLDTVKAGGVDIGFVEGNDDDLPGLESVVMRADRLVVVVNPAHCWAGRTQPIDPRELAETELIVRERGSGTRTVLDDALAPWGGVRSRLELGSPLAILDAVRRDRVAAAVLSELAVAQDVAAGQLVVVPTDGVSFERSLRAVWPSDRSLPPLARRLLAAATRNFDDAALGKG